MADAGFLPTLRVGSWGYACLPAECHQSHPVILDHGIQFSLYPVKLFGDLAVSWIAPVPFRKTAQHSRIGYNIAALLFFVLFLDNLLRREEGQGWDRFWPCSGGLEVMVVYAVLSLLAHVAYWSRIVRGLNQERT